VGGIKKYVLRYIENLPSLTGKVVVDIPCGAGKTSQAFARQGATVKAFDLYPEFMKIEGIQAHYADMTERIPLEDGSVDYIVCQEGIEHLSDKIWIFREFNRILKKGGELIVTTPSLSHTRARLSMFLLESTRIRRMPSTELDGVWFSDKQSDRVYFGHLFHVGVQHLHTLCSVTGFEIQSRRWTDIRISSVVLSVLAYPLLLLASLVAFMSYRKKNAHIIQTIRDQVLWRRVRLNLSPKTLFCKHIFWVLRKNRELDQVLHDLKNLAQRDTC
jgi:SAM-dependent methyltransferase